MLSFNQIKKDAIYGEDRKTYFDYWKGLHTGTVLDNGNEEIVFYLCDDDYWFISIPMQRFFEMKYSEYEELIITALKDNGFNINA